MICPITNNWCRTNGCGEKCYKRDSLGYSTAPQHDAKLPVSGTASPKLKHIVIIGKFDDGKCRQVLINPKTQDVVLSAVIACERQIRVLETIIEGIDIELPS